MVAVIRDLPDESATAALASDIAAAVAPGDAVLLRGELGAGKTAFARAFLRAFTDTPDLEVPSPTFTLVQTYEGGRFPVAHFDLYRLGAPEDLDELGLDEALETGVALVEWPERAEDRLPPTGFDVALDMAGSGRSAQLGARGPAAARLARTLALRSFLAAHNREHAVRHHVKGDASTRRYERVGGGGRTVIVMDWSPAPPPEPDSYDARARRTRTIGPFITIGAALGEAGLSTPDVLAEDEAAGFLLLEDFGIEGVLDRSGSPIEARYAAAVDLLAVLHRRPRSQDIEAAGRTWRLPDYGRDVMRFEHERFLRTFVRDDRPEAEAAQLIARFDEVWTPLYDRLEAMPRTWLLRDFHSPNLMWLADRQGMRRLGVLDFQDALFGPGAYDLMSLLQDARATVPGDLADQLTNRYIAARFDDPDRDALYEAFDILGAHRNLRLVALFNRLTREGRTEYAAHLPRCRAYLDRNLANPVLSDLALWYENVRARAEVVASDER